MDVSLFLLGELVFVILLKCQQAESNVPSDDSKDIVMLTADSFDEELSKNHLFVLFYGTGYESKESTRK